MDDRFNIIRVAEEYGLVLKAVKHRPEFRARCPLCESNLGSPDNDRTGRLYLNVEKDTFKCFRCGARGGVVQFYADLHGVSFDEAKQALVGEKRTILPIERHPIFKVPKELMEIAGFAVRDRSKLRTWYLQGRKNYAFHAADWMWREVREVEASRERLRKALLAATPKEDSSCTTKSFSSAG